MSEESTDPSGVEPMKATEKERLKWDLEKINYCLKRGRELLEENIESIKLVGGIYPNMTVGEALQHFVYDQIEKEIDDMEKQS